ncbi:MAG: hypothetical protein ACLQM6_06850 [Acidobacteriaceae bacterium]
MKIGKETPSGHQLRMLEEARRVPLEAWEFLQNLVNDSDIRDESEQVHPDWLKLYESIRDASLDVSSAVKKEVDEFFAELVGFDRTLRELDLTKQKVTFLLGAGASKPAPSNIPTVKELLPQLLERGRRLDREDVTKLAAFCEERRIDNIEDLLTAAQLATFSSRNPTILRLLNYLLYGGDTEGSGDEINYRRPQSMFVQQSRARRRESAVANVSSVAFLQDTLQVLFGLLASTMLPAEPNKAHEAIANFTKAHQMLL